MRFTKKANYEGSVRKVWNDEKTCVFGIVGTVGDLMDLGVLESCDAPFNYWMYIPAPHSLYDVKFSDTRDGAVSHIPF